MVFDFLTYIVHAVYPKIEHYLGCRMVDYLAGLTAEHDLCMLVLETG